jgi:hypothetical protein
VEGVDGYRLVILRVLAKIVVPLGCCAVLAIIDYDVLPRDRLWTDTKSGMGRFKTLKTFVSTMSSPPCACCRINTATVTFASGEILSCFTLIGHEVYKAPVFKASY